MTLQRDSSVSVSVDPAKLLLTIAVWLASLIAFILRWRGQLLAKRFAWTGLTLFAAAMLSLSAVDASRHPVSTPPPQIVPRQP